MILDDGGDLTNLILDKYPEKCDLILVLDKGKVIQVGKHENLCLENGYYKETYDKQKRKK